MTKRLPKATNKQQERTAAMNKKRQEINRKKHPKRRHPMSTVAEASDVNRALDL